MEILTKKSPGFRLAAAGFGLLVLLLAALTSPQPAVCQSPSPAAASAGSAKGPAIQAAFLLDRSGSMIDPGLTGKPDPRFPAEIAKVRKSATWVLDSLKEYPDAKVSLWYFGERDRLVPFAENLAPTEALGKVDAFFSSDAGKYRDQRTYVAYSMFQLVGRLLELGPQFKPTADLPANGDTFYLFVYTDGNEDNDPGWDNGPYADWVKRHSRSLQIHWKKWTLYGQDEPPRGWPVPPPVKPASAAPVPPEPDTVSYDVLFGEPDLAAHVNLQKDSPERPVDLLVPRTIRLVPRVLGDQVSAQDQEELGLLVSPPDKIVQGPPPSQALDLKVQATIDWRGVAGASTTPEWTLRSAPRNVRAGTPGNPPQPNVIERRSLQLELSDTKAVLPSLYVEAFRAYETAKDPDGRGDGVARFPVALVQDQLARELHRAYPNSTFVFQGSSGKQPRRLADVEVSDVPEYLFTVTAQEGVTPHSPLPTMQADQWWMYPTSTRTFHITGPAGVKARHDFSIRVQFQGQDLEKADDLVALTSPTSTGLSTSAREKEDVVLSTPAKVQDALWSFLNFGFQRPAGEYLVEVTIAPVVEQAPDARYRVLVQEGGSTAPAQDRLVLRIPLEIKARPVHLVQWFLLGVALLLAALGALRWHNRVNFRKVVLGIPRNYVDLQDAYGKGLEGSRALFLGLPCYVNLESAGRTAFDHNTSADVHRGRERRPLNTMGLLPRPGGFNMWCVAVRRSESERFEIRVEGRAGGRPLEVIGKKPRGGKASHESTQSLWIGYDSLTRGETCIQTWKTIRNAENGEWSQPELVESYPIRIATTTRSARPLAARR